MQFIMTKLNATKCNMTNSTYFLRITYYRIKVSSAPYNLRLEVLTTVLMRSELIWDDRVLTGK